MKTETFRQALETHEVEHALVADKKMGGERPVVLSWVHLGF